MQAARADLFAQCRVGGFVLQRMLGDGDFPLAQFVGFPRRQVSAEHQSCRGTEQWQHRTQLRDHRHCTHRRFDVHHGCSLIAPHGEETGFVEFVAQFRQGQGGDFQHVHTVECRQAHAQGFAAQTVVVGRRVLFGEAAGNQRLQVPVNLARRHLHVFGQARQRGGRRQLGQSLEDVGADLGGADFLFAVTVAGFFHGAAGFQYEWASL